LATLISHPLPALICNQFNKDLPSKRSLLTWSIGLTLLPDADVISFALGISYYDMLGHRGFTHSILFSIIIAFLIARFALRYEKAHLLRGFLILFVSSMSHGILDALTNGGLGVGFFIPFTEQRYFFPATPIEVSPIGVRNFLSQRGLEVILSELKTVWIPGLLILFPIVISKRARGFRKRK
jgi:inner membrane protein